MYIISTTYIFHVCIVINYELSLLLVVLVNDYNDSDGRQRSGGGDGGSAQCVHGEYHSRTYRVFIKYCVFSKILKYMPDSGLSRFPVGVSVSVHNGRSNTSAAASEAELAEFRRKMF